MKSVSRALCLLIASLCAPALQAQEPLPEPTIPLSNTSSNSYESEPPLTYAQQVARFESEQRILRMQFNKWIGHEPLRPAMNANYMSNGMQRYYLPSRGWIVTPGNVRTWYW